MDYELQRFTRHCAKTGRLINEGEEFYSVLLAQGASMVRQDFAIEAWTAPPEGAIGWWKSRVPEAGTPRAKLPPGEVLLDLLHDLEARPEHVEMRYVLALLLLRKRILRLADKGTNRSDDEILELLAPRTAARYRVQVLPLDEQRISSLQEELSQLLHAEAE